MGVIRSTQSFESEVEDLRVALRSSSAAATAAETGEGWTARKEKHRLEPAAGDRVVCVTSGLSYLGFALVNELVVKGYVVRLAVENQEDLEKAREMELVGETNDAAGVGGDLTAAVADFSDVESLCKAFEGCSGVFHTSAFADPSGVSGYTKHMAEMEAKVAERVIQACVRTPSVRKCVFTSSLLACIWRRISPVNRHLRVDENCWSDESFCREKKLWLALGKTMAEKAAWRGARGRDLKLATLCPALLTGPGFCRRNSTASIAYIKGAQEMYVDGLLATSDIRMVVEAHIRVYKDMSDTACGRYICYDHIISREEDLVELARQLGLTNNNLRENMISSRSINSLELSNKKLSRLMSSSKHCSYDRYFVIHS